MLVYFIQFSFILPTNIGVVVVVVAVVVVVPRNAKVKNSLKNTTNLKKQREEKSKCYQLYLWMKMTSCNNDCVCVVKFNIFTFMICVEWRETPVVLLFSYSYFMTYITLINILSLMSTLKLILKIWRQYQVFCFNQMYICICICTI